MQNVLSSLNVLTINSFPNMVVVKQETSIDCFITVYQLFAGYLKMENIF